VDCRIANSGYTLRVIRNLILDWSGTLIDDLPAVWHATNYVLTQAKCEPMTLDEFRAEFCLPFTRFYGRHVPHIALPRLEIWFHQRFRQMQHTVRALPHAREFLLFCRSRKLRRFLLSAAHPEHYAAQAAATGLGRYLDKAYVQAHDKRKMIRRILEENRLRPDQTLFVGDMEHDIETARHGGIHACAVLTGYNTLGQLRAAKPDLIVEHLGELREILEHNGLEPRRALRPAADPLRDPRQRTPVPTVGALIFNGAGAVLLVRTHKWSDLWGIPGGKIKWNETSEAALRREIREETGLRIANIEFVLAQDCLRSREFYREAHFILLNYTCRCAGEPRVRLNDEARECRWVLPKQALRLPLNKPTRRLLLAVRDRRPEGKRKKGRRKHVENQHR
jgi:phosphoglycolate phosphatase